MLNFSLYEDGNGGQLVLRNNEIIQSSSLATLAYIAMFGGNIEAETQKENAPGELKFDWWGNDSNKPSTTWINSQTERTLRGIDLSSSSLFAIQQAVENDVKQLDEFGDVIVDVTFPGLNKIKIVITITEPSIKKNTRLSLVWDATRNEIIEKNII